MSTLPEQSLEPYRLKYNEIMGATIRMNPDVVRLLADFKRYQYTVEDLELTLRWLLAENKKFPRPRNLGLWSLLSDLGKFESWRSDAESCARSKAAAQRAFHPAPGEKARASMCHHEPVPPAKEPVLPRSVVAKLFREMGENLAI